MLFAKSTMLLLCLIMALFLWERVKYVKYVPLWYYCVFEYDTMVLPWFVDIHHDIFYFYIIWKKAIVLLFFFYCITMLFGDIYHGIMMFLERV